MTETTDLTTVDDALAEAAPRLDSIEQRVAVATYRTLAEGRPASAAAIAATAGVEEATVDGMLHEWGAVFRDDSGDVVGFWGLALADMPHRLDIDGRELRAWCAWDPMFLALIVGPLTVATDDPVSGDTITYRLDKDGMIHDLSHPDSALSFLRPDREWDDQVMTTFCHFVLHFSSTDAADRWTTEHEGTFVLALDDASALARRHTARTFGEAVT